MKAQLKPLRGIVRLWAYDLGSASFLGTGILGLVFAVLLSFSTKADVAEILLAMGLVSAALACAWQLNRVNATEWASLVPGYIRNLLLQSLLVMVSYLSICVMIIFSSGALEMLLPLGLPLCLGVGFIYFCVLKSRGFYLSFLLFLAIPFFDLVHQALPLAAWISWAITPLLLLLIYRYYTGVSWQAESRTVYLNGLEMGWFWLPQFSSGRLFSRLDRYLHPVSFFIGPMIIVLMLGLPCLALVLAMLVESMNGDFPVLFLLVQFAIITCCLVHWSRIQRWRATELLLTLPGFSGRQGMRDAFVLSQNRLIVIMTGNVALVALLILAMQAQFNLIFWLHISLSAFWGCALVLGLGCACRSALHITLTMLVVILQSAWTSWTLTQLDNADPAIWWLMLDLLAGSIAILVLKWGKHMLWRNDSLIP